MKRSRKILSVCHCILNANAKIPPLASYQGVHEAVRSYIEEGAGLLQFPCPELSFLGSLRWGMTREQYDVPAYRRHCRNILEPYVDQLESLHAAGCKILGVMGVDGSPSCGVTYSCGGYCGGSILDKASIEAQAAAFEKISGKGVFTRMLSEMLAERGLEAAFFSVEEKRPSDTRPKRP